MEKGLTIIYWGFGKGKTTAAMGTALRALGQGRRVLIVQFMKGGSAEGWETGEERILKWLQKHVAQAFRPDVKAKALSYSGPTLEFHTAGKGWVKIRGDKKPLEDHEQAACDGYAFARDQVSGGRFQLVILDEILSAVDSSLLTVDQIKDLIAAKPPTVHLLMTGHKEYPELAELADLVTRMEKVKHPYDQGVLAQQGIDF